MADVSIERAKPKRPAFLGAPRIHHADSLDQKKGQMNSIEIFRQSTLNLTNKLQQTEPPKPFVTKKDTSLEGFEHKSSDPPEPIRTQSSHDDNKIPDETVSYIEKYFNESGVAHLDIDRSSLLAAGGDPDHLNVVLANTVKAYYLGQFEILHCISRDTDGSLILDPRKVSAVKARMEAALSYSGTPATTCQWVTELLNGPQEGDKVIHRRHSFAQLGRAPSLDASQHLNHTDGDSAEEMREVYLRTKKFLNNCGRVFHRRGLPAPRLFVSYYPHTDPAIQASEMAAVGRLVSLLQKAGAIVEHCTTVPRPDGSTFSRSIAECDFVLLLCTTHMAAATKMKRKDAPYKAEYQMVLSKSWANPEMILPVLVEGDESVSLPLQIASLPGRRASYDCREGNGKETVTIYWNAVCSEDGIVPTLFNLRENRETWKSYEALYFDITRLPDPTPHEPRRESKQQAISARFDAIRNSSEDGSGVTGLVALVGDTTESTSLAVSYAAEAIDNDHYDFARVIDVKKENFHASWLEFASSVGVDISRLSIGDVIVKALRRVSHFRYLLIFSNAESPLSIKKMIPPDTGTHHHIIVTSSNAKMWTDPILIGPWSEEEAMTYVRKFCSATNVPQPDDAAIGGVIAALDWTPTAIYMVMGHMELHSAPIEEIVAALPRPVKGAKHSDSPHQAVWKLVKPKLEAEHEQSYRLVCLLSCLNYRISRSLLLEMCEKVFDEEFEDLLDPLLRLSLIKRTNESYYKMSTTMQNVICSSEFNLDFDKKRGIVNMADGMRFGVIDHVLPPIVDALYSVFPIEDEKTEEGLIYTCVVSTHVTRLLKIMDMLRLEESDGAPYQKSIEMTTTLLHIGGQSHLVQGNYRDCQDMLGRAREMLDDIFPEGHVMTVKTLSIMATMYYQMGQLDEALDILAEWKVAGVKLLGPNHDEIARGLHVTGLVNRSLGKYHEALECYSEVLRIRRSLFGDSHEFIASTLSSMASVHLKLGELTHAVECFQEALSVRLGLYGSKHITVVGTRNNIAMVYNNMGEHGKALDCYKTNLAVFRSVHGKQEHPLLADTLNNVGVVYFGIGHYGLAAQNMSEALKIRRVLYGSDHLSVAECLNNLGNTYCAQGKYSEAVECCLQALKIKKQILTGSHPSLAGNLKNLTIIYGHLKDFDKALNYATEALEMVTNSEGPDSDAVADVLNVMGDIYKKSHMVTEALEKYTRALEIKREVYDEGSNASVAEILNNIGAVYTVRGRNVDARVMFEEAIGIVRKLYHPHVHHSIADILVNIGNAHLNEQHLDLAMQAYDEALNIYRSTRGAHHPVMASVLCCIAAVFCFRGNHEEALSKYRQALEIQRVHHSSGEIAVVLHNMGILHYQMHEFDIALKNFEEAFELRRGEVGSEIWQAETLNNMGMTCNKLKDYSQATEFFVQSLGLYKLYNGAEEAIADTMCNIASSYYLDRKYDLSLSRFEEAVAIHRRIGSSNSTLADVYANIGHAHFHKKDFVSSMEAYEMCYHLTVPDENNLDFTQSDSICRVVQMLCSSLCHMGCMDEAINRYKVLLAACEKSQNDTNARALQVKLQGLLNATKKRQADSSRFNITRIWSKSSVRYS